MHAYPALHFVPDEMKIEENTRRSFIHSSHFVLPLKCILPPSQRRVIVAGDSGEAERSFRGEAERRSGMIPNTIGA